MYSPLRIKIFNWFIYVVLIALLLFLFKIQIFDGDKYREQSENNRIRLIPLNTSRGRIFDRQNRVIADNRASFDLQVIPQDFFMESVDDLAAIINVEASDITRKIQKRRTPSFSPLLLKRDLTEAEVHKLEERSADFGGLLIEVSGRRYYPWGEVAAHILGYLGKISPKEYAVKKFMGYLINDYVGRMGVEYLFDEVLRGVHGGKQIEVDARGREVRELAYRPPFAGTDLQLTIDIDLQAKIHEAVGEDAASVCMLDVRTGEILALVSTPSFDPNAFVTPSRSAERVSLLRNKALPFLNRAISSRYPPGSVFKLVTALTALELGKITPQSSIECSGAYQLTPETRSFHCWAKYGHGDVNLVKALQQSCNVYFYKIGRMVGADAIARFSKKIALGDPVNMELSGAARGLIPSTRWKKEELGEQWYQGETLHYAIGQGYLAVTPIQVLRLIAIIANDGVIIEPTIIKGVRHVPRKVGIAKRDLQAVKQGMFSAVETKYGTANNARVAFFKMAGKTGTAQNAGDPHSWFAGFFPYDSPRVALVVFVEHGGTGGGKAASLANKAATFWHERYSKKE